MKKIIALVALVLALIGVAAASHAAAAKRDRPWFD